MSKTKKKKKYTPKPVYYPAVIVAMHSFEPLEKAIEELLYAESIIEDQNGDYVFIEPTGRVRHYEKDLFVYIQYALIYGQRSNQKLNVDNLVHFRKVLMNKLEFKESEIKAVLEDIKNFKILFSRIHPLESREILRIIKENNQSIQQHQEQQKQINDNIRLKLHVNCI